MPTLDELAREGIAAIGEMRYNDAIERFQQTLELEPDRPDMNNALGMAHMHRGDVGSAVPHLERAVELAEPYDDDEHGEMKLHFITGLATAYQLTDRIAEARRHLQDAVDRWPDKLDPRLQLGQLLLTSCQLEEGAEIYRALTQYEHLDQKGKDAAEAVVGCIDLLEESEHQPDIFLRAHRDSYTEYFDDIATQQEGWYAEAARMSKGEDDELRPIITEGARPYAMSRVDLVNPKNGEIAEIYSDSDPMVVAVEGLEPLAQLPVMFPWKEHELDVWVCSQVPWHWLTITIQFDAELTFDERIDIVDPIFADWYLAGYNGDFGEQDSGRFHYITDPEPVGDRAIAYTVDLGRSKYEAVETLLKRIVILNATRPIRRVLLGNGYLPD
jgi:tetratricopeptide (TPR) repeat protein